MVLPLPPPFFNFLKGYRSEILPDSSRPPSEHHPPHLIRYLSATSSAARSTPVCPPEIIFKMSTLYWGGRRLARIFSRLAAGIPPVRLGLQSPVGMISAPPTIRMTVCFGAGVRCRTPFGTTKPCRGPSSTTLSSRSIRQWPSRTKKNRSEEHQ